MAKTKGDKLTDSFDSLKPYIERALTDDDFRNNVRTALSAAGAVYGDVAKGKNGMSAATKLAGDKKTQENLRRAFEELNAAGYRLKGKKKSRKGRKSVLLVGFIVGLFYNPWTGPQTRQWLLDRIAGGDDLQPLESWDTGEAAASFEADESVEQVAEAASADGGS
jgi:hypothetical protein